MAIETKEAPVEAPKTEFKGMADALFDIRGGDVITGGTEQIVTTEPKPEVLSAPSIVGEEKKEEPVKETPEKILKEKEPEKEDTFKLPEMDLVDQKQGAGSKLDNASGAEPELPAGQPEKVGQAFNLVKTENKSLKKRLAELEQSRPDQSEVQTKLSDLQRSLDEAREQNKQYEQATQMFDVQSSAKFKKEVTEPIGKITKKVGAIEKSYDMDEGSLIEIVKSKRGQAKSEALADISSNLNEYEKSKLFGLVDQYEDISENMQGLIENANTEAEQYTKQQQEAMNANTQQQLQNYQNTIEESLGEMQKNLVWFKKGKGDASAEFNRSIDEAISSAKNVDVQKLSESDIAKLVVNWSMSKHERLVLPQLLKELDTLRKRQAEYNKAEPSTGKVASSAPVGDGKFVGMADIVSGKMSGN